MAGKPQENYTNEWTWLYTNMKAIAGSDPVYLYRQLTGTGTKVFPLPEDLRPAHKAIAERKEIADLLISFYGMYQFASYNHLLEVYRADKITAGLLAILEYQPEFDIERMGAELDGAIFGDAVLKAVQAGQIDFTPFNDTNDTAPDWFLKYRLSPSPVPGYFGKLEALDKTPDGLKETPLETFHNGAKEELKKSFLNAMAAGVSPDIIQTIIDDVKERYQISKAAGEKNYFNSVFPYTSKRLAGFVVDIAGRKIFDLRPHVDELRELLAPGPEPMKEFYLLLQRYLTNYKKATKERAGIFDHERFIMLKNSRDSTAVTSITGGISAMAIQNELFITDDDGEMLYNYETTVPIKAGEVVVKISGTPKGRALKPSTQKLKILCDALFTRYNVRCIAFSIDEYMELCGRGKSKDEKKEFKKTLRQNLTTLRKTSFKLTGPNIRAGEIGIVDAWEETKDGTIKIGLTPEYCANLQNSAGAGIIEISEYIYKSDERNIHIIPFLIQLHRNRCNYNNIAKGGRRPNTISIKSLIDGDPDLLFKCKRNINREYRKLIIEPVINVLNVLNRDGVITSKFVDADGIEHTPEELQSVTLADFMDSKKWLLFYEIVGYKVNPEIIKAALERAKQREDQQIINKAKVIQAKRKAARKKTEQKTK